MVRWKLTEAPAIKLTPHVSKLSLYKVRLRYGRAGDFLNEG